MRKTGQQVAFENEITGGEGHVALLARAGSGKTTTILNSVVAYNKKYPNHEIAVCAYNKAIAEEMKAKLVKMDVNIPWRSLNIATLHSMGYGLLKYKFDCELRNDKIQSVFEQFVEPNLKTEEDRKLVTTSRNLVRHAKVAGFGIPGCGDIGRVRDWWSLDEHYDISDLERHETNRAIELAQYAYKKSLQITEVIDFDDMILLPLYYNLNTKFKKDLVFVDEAQDLSITRQMLMEKFVKTTQGRIAVVGDDRQAIYGFSGAESDAMNSMIERYEAKVLPLTVSWRCSVRVIEEAQELVSDIEHAPNAEEGEVYTAEDIPDDIGITDAVLCRNTAPLIQQAYALIKRGIKCRVEGRALGAALLKLTGKWQVKTVDTFMERLEIHVNQKRSELADKPGKLAELEDRYSALCFVSEYCLSKGDNSIQNMRSEIENLFSDDVKNVVTLCTYHRSKGREWDNVYLLHHNILCPSKYARKPWQELQEENLAYVAITRARSTLTYVEKATD